jgi:hypothetical protein
LSSFAPGLGSSIAYEPCEIFKSGNEKAAFTTMAPTMRAAQYEKVCYDFDLKLKPELTL